MCLNHCFHLSIHFVQTNHRMAAQLLLEWSCVSSFDSVLAHTGSPQIFQHNFFVSTQMYPENREGTQVLVGSMKMEYISDAARNRTHNLFRPKRLPIPIGHCDGHLWFQIIARITKHILFPNQQQHNIVVLTVIEVVRHFGHQFIHELALSLESRVSMPTDDPPLAYNKNKTSVWIGVWGGRVAWRPPSIDWDSSSSQN